MNSVLRPALIDFYAGGGAATLGAVACGFDVLGVEYDLDAWAVHEACAGPCIHADIRDHAAWLPRVLAWLAGRPLRVWASPPCQDWSAAGKRAGASGERNGWPWLWDAIDALRAAGVVIEWIACENVGGMLHHLRRANCDRGRRPNPAECPGCYWQNVALRDAAARFRSVRWRVLDAVNYGAPQRRKRLILACGPAATAWPEQTHYPIGGAALPWWRTVNDAIGVPVIGGGARGRGMDEWRPREFGDAPAPAVTGFGSTGGLYVRATGMRPPVFVPPDQPSPCVQAGSHNDTPIRIVVGDGSTRRARPDENARLQAWPEVIPALSACRTLSARYRVVGNAVPPPFAEALIRALLCADAAVRPVAQLALWERAA